VTESLAASASGLNRLKTPAAQYRLWRLRGKLNLNRKAQQRPKHLGPATSRRPAVAGSLDEPSADEKTSAP
jgi:hypothetical protein